jgi:hypothetical protein
MQLTTLSINNNEVGPLSSCLVQGFLAKLKYLRLIDLKGATQLIHRCLPLLASAADLSTLVISGNNLSLKSTFQLFKTYLTEEKTLIKLDLSWSFLSTKHLKELFEILKIKTI